MKRRRPLDVLGIGVLGKVPLAALRDEAGAPVVGRRPLARVLSLRPSPSRSVSADVPVVIADPLASCSVPREWAAFIMLRRPPSLD